MRYIDADELIEFFDSYPDHIEFDVEDIKSIINEQDAADVRENVKGKWILHIDDLFPAESTMECNQCHKHQPITIDDNFCPNCGADMRGDKNG